jgi:hypothetical protein
MPADHHDVRTNERIEAFLEGPPRPARKRQRAAERRAHRPIALDTAAEWRAALHSEAVRADRYGRPATVLVVDVGAESAALAPVELVEPVLDAIRHEARETDRAVRVSPTRFHLLLPETGARDADRFADRLRDACRNRLNGHGGLLRLRVEAQTPGHGRSLVDALADAERRIDG